MSKHTPGPWIFYAYDVIDRGYQYGIKAPAPYHWVIPPLNINPADARLIAAAPEMLEALNRLQKDINTGLLYKRISKKLADDMSDTIHGILAKVEA